MKTIGELAKEAAKHIRTEHGLQLSDFIATEFLRVAFELRDAEAVPFAWHHEDEGLMYENHHAGNVPLYLHAPAPSDLQAAKKTLENLGYTYCGGELWKPPLWGKPNFNLLDSLQAENERLKSAADLYKTQANDSRLFADMKKEECKQLRAELAALREAIDRHVENGKVFERVVAELAALKQQEPVGEMQTGIAKFFVDVPAGAKLYTAPATDYKDVAERLLGALQYAVKQVTELATVPGIEEAIAAARSAGLGEE